MLSIALSYETTLITKRVLFLEDYMPPWLILDNVGYAAIIIIIICSEHG